MAKPNGMLDKLRGEIIVSCQPVVGGPMDSPAIIKSQGLAAEHGGAGGLRVEGTESVRDLASVSSLPIIGITKRTLSDSPVRITPHLDDVVDLVTAGANIVAFDATQRNRPVPTQKIIQRIHELGAIAMADCACIGDGEQALDEGAEILGTTLSGYAYGVISENSAPDLELVEALSTLDEVFVIAEGRYRTPIAAATAVQRGADAVVVGSAITRVEYITRWFSDAMARADVDEASVDNSRL